MPFRLGLIINPIAGMGGRVGLKGTDGPAALAEARRRGAAPMAAERAERALQRLPAHTDVVTGRGELGEQAAGRAGIACTVVGGQADCGPAATREAASAMLARGVDLLLFAGGDGTARDVVDIVGDRLPVLGVPTGVKMQSAVFATTPEGAGDVAARFSVGARETTSAEVMDIDETELGKGRLSPRLHGYARVPRDRVRLQHAKSRSNDAESALGALCRVIASSLEPDTVYLFGPGTTTQRILAAAGMNGTLLGVDAVENNRLVGTDLSEAEILRLTAGKPVRIIVTVIGGQGFIFGRGNQQISPEVIRRAGRDGVTVVAAADKLLALDGGRLWVDTGDPTLDLAFRGYLRVQTSPDEIMLCKVAA
jgi:predicted polyphosphate/ATP-dependent NAD kinase